jgi:hypothetical protein
VKKNIKFCPGFGRTCCFAARGDTSNRDLSSVGEFDKLIDNPWVQACAFSMSVMLPRARLMCAVKLCHLGIG